MPSKNKPTPFLLHLTRLSFRILYEYIQDKELQRGDYSGALNGILKEYYAMVVTTRLREKDLRLSRPAQPLATLQDQIMKIKASLRGYQPTQEELKQVRPIPPNWGRQADDER